MSVDRTGGGRLVRFARHAFLTSVNVRGLTRYKEMMNHHRDDDTSRLGLRKNTKRKEDWGESGERLFPT